MRPVRLLLIYFVCVFLGAALLAPWVYHFLQWVAEQNSMFQKLAGFPFHRFVNRCLIFLALLGLWPFLRSLGIHSWNDLGFAPLRLHWKKGAAGFLIGFLSLGTLGALAILFGARIIKLSHTETSLAVTLLGATLSAVVVAILEESLYRGALFGALRKSNSLPFALFVSSAVYALLHFFAKPGTPATINWSSGFITMASMFEGFTNLEILVPKFFNLLIVGLILGFAFQRTGSLYLSIGLHAGWIFWLNAYGLLTDKVPEVKFWIWGSKKIIDGWLATLALLFVFGFLFARHQKAKQTLDVDVA